jgi:TolA-binding protein
MDARQMPSVAGHCMCVVLFSALTLLGGVGWVAPPPAPVPLDHGVRSGTRQLAVTFPAPEIVDALTPPTTGPDETSSAQQLRQLASQLEQLRREVRAQQQALQQQQEEVKRRWRRCKSDTRAPHAVAAERVDVPVQSAEAWQQARVAQLEAELTRQPGDDAGSREAVEQVATAVEQVVEHLGPEAESRSALVEAFCCTTLCRIELLHENASAMESFMHEFPQQLGCQAHAHLDIVHNADGSLSMVMYLAKDGHTFPLF